MTIKSKTFYVNDFEFDFLISQHARQIDATLYIDAKEGRSEITISWKEDRKAEVTESQIDAIVGDWYDNARKCSLESFLKEHIFKDVK